MTEWEDRWRTLSGAGGPADLPLRPAGGSAAAAAGAAAGASASPPDEHDPAFIMAVLARATSAVPEVPAPTGPAPSELARTPSGFGADPPPLEPVPVPHSPSAGTETPDLALDNRGTATVPERVAAAVSTGHMYQRSSSESPAAGLLGAIPRQTRLLLLAACAAVLIIILITTLS